MKLWGMIMNKKLFFLLILFAFVAQPAHAGLEWVMHPVRYVAVGAGDFVRDSYHVLKPEWSTAASTEYAHDGKKYKRELFGVGEPATMFPIDENMVVNGVAKLESQQGEGEKEVIDAKQTEIDRILDLPRDAIGRIFSASEKREKIEVVDEKKSDGGEVKKEKGNYIIHVIPENERVISNSIQDSEQIIKITTVSFFIDKKTVVDHEDQTTKKVAQMRFFKFLYKFKRTYKLERLGLYPFMKPYALAWAAGLTFAVYKLFKKLGIYETYLKPNTHDLQKDELDNKMRS